MKAINYTKKMACPELVEGEWENEYWLKNVGYL